MTESTGSLCNELVGCLIPRPFSFSAKVVWTLSIGSGLLALEMEASKSAPHSYSVSEFKLLFLEN